MSIILVWKGKSACLVDKKRDPDRKGKYIEDYKGSLGVISKEEMELRRDQLYVFDTNYERMTYANHAFKFVEVKKDIPRRKEEKPTKGLIKPKAKPRKVKEEVKEEPKIVDDRPKKQPVVMHKVPENGMKLRGLKTMSSKQHVINTKIKKIEKDISFAKKVIKQKRNVQTFTKTERESIGRDIGYMQTVVESGNKAISILKKQRAELRR